MAARSARVRFEVEVKSELDKLSRQLDNMNKKMGKTASASQTTAKSTSFLAGATKAVGAAWAAWESAKWVVGFLWDTSQAAANLGETMSKASVVFGGSITAVSKFGDTAATSIGQSKQQAIEAAATFGNLFKTIGLTESQFGSMSTQLVTLAGDLASFNNTSIDDAMAALRSGLIGETEPIRKFGVLLDDATLKQYALNQGLIDNARGALPPAIRAQAAYAAILDQTTTAQGDFLRTSDQQANQQRIMAAEWENLKSKVGARALPYMTQKFRIFNSALDHANKGEWKQALWLTDAEMRKLNATGTAATTSLGKTAQAYDSVKRAASEATKARKEYEDAQAAADDAQLASLQAQQRTIDAEKALTAAVKEHGRKSREARIAALELKIARREQAAATDKARSATDKARAAEDKAKKNTGYLEFIRGVEEAWRRAAYQVGIYNTRIATGKTGAAKQLSGDNQIPWTAPRKAQGGITYSPTLTLIGENGPERVTPLRGASAAPIVINVNITGASANVYADAKNGAYAGARRARLEASMMGV